ncbi:aldehyde dehydrogenase family protein [Planctobacterium marinum]|uniref:Aldehyde dehydrogenase n=1 Tax=Planctobacterium marinum TaxID=1631968 RepID=A0AA48KNR7_9ALTE|nr:aldehyde dehydrogenase [Planctobacterium marinum]
MDAKNANSIPDIVTRLRNTYATGKTRSAQWRIQQLQQVKKMTLDNEEKIRAALEADLGKCQQEAWTAEISYISTEVDHTIKHLKKWMKPRKVKTPLVAQPGKSYLQPEPLGVALIIGAWNYPWQLVIAPYVAALSAGNCAILKPSELAENTSRLMAELVPKYLDGDAVAVVEGGVEESTELLKQRFDHILYTGGEAVGKIVMRAAAEHLTPVTLELGGKSPCVVDKSANLDVTVSRIAWCKWMNAGQTCVAPDYILVDESIKEAFIEKLQAKITDFYGEQPADSKDYARIINTRHWARIMGLLDGQNVITGGEGDEQTRYIAPTLVLEPDPESTLMQQEIFGPVLPILTYRKTEEAVHFINQRSKPLAMYVFSKDKLVTHAVLHQTSAGNVCVNDGMMFMTNQDLPFGGVGTSGMGSYCGQAGFDTFSHLKAVMERSFALDVDIRYPPYTEKKLKMLKMMV